MPESLEPMDEFNQRLLEQVHPANWTNPTPADRYHLVVIGGGTAGLVAAAGAAGLGAKVALVERNLLGGDCLNRGCVPSKALIRSGRIAYALGNTEEFGIHANSPAIDFSRVMQRLRRLRAALSGNDSAARFQGLGVDVFFGNGQLAGPDTVLIDDQTLRFRKALLATGSRPRIPLIPGLELAGFLTSDTVFSLTTLPPRLAVLGAGPIGCELAQALARLGAQVTLLEMGSRILPREDSDASALVEASLRRDGITIHTGCRIHGVTLRGEQKIIQIEGTGQSEVVVEAILVAVGRQPNVENLNLEAAGVSFHPDQGIQVNDYLQTSQQKIYAAGDVCTRYPFTHAADALARIVLQNALFAGRARASALTIPWCTYTDPELAHVGLSEQDASRLNISIQTFKQELELVDRAVLDGQTQGFFKIHVKKGTDQIIGATVVADHAGDLIAPITLAMTQRIGLKKIARIIQPYPTQAEALKKIGDAYNRTRLTPRTQWLLRRILAWTC